MQKCIANGHLPYCAQKLPAHWIRVAALFPCLDRKFTFSRKWDRLFPIVYIYNKDLSLNSFDMPSGYTADMPPRPSKKPQKLNPLPRSSARVANLKAPPTHTHILLEMSKMGNSPTSETKTRSAEIASGSAIRRKLGIYLKRKSGNN